jgi:hypothetical protein
MPDCPVTATLPATTAVAMMSARITTNYPAGRQRRSMICYEPLCHQT